MLRFGARVAAGAAVAATGLVAAGLTSAAHPASRASVAQAQTPADPKTFTISGDVHGLYPSAARQVTLTVANESNSAIVVQKLTVTVSPSRTGCAAANILLGPQQSAGVLTVNPNLHIAGRSTGTYPISITMAATATNRCAATSFALTYTGSAVKA